MDAWLCIPIFLALVLVYSTSYNTRRTENSSYGLWSVVLAQLYNDHTDVFIPCPQYGLFVSPVEHPLPADPDDSIVTIADRQARGVYVDLTVLLPRVVLSKCETMSQSITGLFGALGLANLPHRMARMSEVEVAILAELKRPPPRHPTDILSYMEKTKLILDAAVDQSSSQAHCLFSSLKYSHQDTVMVIAAAGEWWRFRIFSRQSFTHWGAFRAMAYIINLRLWSVDDEPDTNTYDEDEDEEHIFVAPADVKTARKKLLWEAEERETLKKQNNERRRLQAEQRDERAERRRHQRNLQEALDDLVAKQVYPYSDQALDECWEFRGRLLVKKDDDETGSFMQPLSDGPIIVEMVMDKWTKPMRLGTEVSEQYLGFISNQLKEMAEKERSRRCQVL